MARRTRELFLKVLIERDAVDAGGIDKRNAPNPMMGGDLIPSAGGSRWWDKLCSSRD